MRTPLSKETHTNILSMNRDEISSNDREETVARPARRAASAYFQRRG
jgi:hypothetical protein